MRRVLMQSSMFLVFAGLTWSQSFTDAAAVIAGGSVGTGAGKKVGEGISSVLQNVNSTTKKAAKAEVQPEKVARVEKPAEKAPSRSVERADGGGSVLQTSPGGVVKDHSLVPPPPPKKVAVVPPPPPLPAPPPFAMQPIPVPVLPPPPQATAEDLKTIASGSPRAEVLKLGAPASRISMYDDGHLVEIFRYQTRDTTFGVVRLSDGSVSSVQLR